MLLAGDNKSIEAKKLSAIYQQHRLGRMNTHITIKTYPVSQVFLKMRLIRRGVFFIDQSRVGTTSM